jgi:hypothetical protein
MTMGKCERRRKEAWGRDYIHCEVDGAIINITEGLYDMKGRKVTSVAISPYDSYSGERIWRTIPKVHNVRIVQLSKKAH